MLETTVGIVETWLDAPIGVNLPDYRVCLLVWWWATRKGLVDFDGQRGATW